MKWQLQKKIYKPRLTYLIKSIVQNRETNCSYRKDGKGYRGMGSGCAEITYGYKSAKETLFDLWKNDAKGWVKLTVKNHDKKRKY